MTRSTASRRARNSASLTIGARRRPASRPSRRRCFFASSRVEPDSAVIWSSAERPWRTLVTVLAGSSPPPSPSSPARRRRRRRREVPPSPPSSPPRRLGVVRRGALGLVRVVLTCGVARLRRPTCAAGDRPGGDGDGRLRPRRRSVSAWSLASGARSCLVRRLVRVGLASWPAFVRALALLGLVLGVRALGLGRPRRRPRPPPRRAAAFRVRRGGACATSGAWKSTAGVLAADSSVGGRRDLVGRRPSWTRSSSSAAFLAATSPRSPSWPRPSSPGSLPGRARLLARWVCGSVAESVFLAAVFLAAVFLAAVFFAAAFLAPASSGLGPGRGRSVAGGGSGIVAGLVVLEHVALLDPAPGAGLSYAGARLSRRRRQAFGGGDTLRGVRRRVVAHHLPRSLGPRREPSSAELLSPTRTGRVAVWRRPALAMPDPRDSDLWTGENVVGSIGAAGPLRVDRLRVWHTASRSRPPPRSARRQSPAGRRVRRRSPRRADPGPAG